MKILILVLLTLFAYQLTSAQVNHSPDIPYRCDAMLAVLDNAAADALKSANTESFVIVVVYLGNGEKSNSYAKQRLKAVESYLTKMRGLSKERLVLAHGKKRLGLGKIETYIGGKLSFEFFVPKRARICVSCCPSAYET